MATSIDMTNPGVRRLLDGDRAGDIASPASGKRELVQVAGDMDHGLASRIDLSSGKTEVLVIDRKSDVPLHTIDVYVMPGEPLKVHILCPRCKNHLTIPGDKKAIEWDPKAENPRARDIVALGVPPHIQAMAKTGRISIEPFECTWELDAGKKVGASEFSGGNLCRWRAAIDNNLVKNA
jgi:hypothetical protein